ncbi:hypothetical protein MD588_23860 [Photobacterium sp. SDRW27]|nr:hypothetical protein [Photobacterium obscurum]MCW8331840.1 hypothetical protein [Photobacterium obscurum]
MQRSEVNSRFPALDTGEAYSLITVPRPLPLNSRDPEHDFSGLLSRNDWN